MSYRLLVLDLDGTVITRELTIAPAVVDAISRAQAHGVFVTVATGRVYTSALQFLPRLGVSQPVITFQGALVRDPVSGETIHAVGLQGDRAAMVVSRLRQLGIFTIAFHGDFTMVERRSPELDLYLSFHPGGEADVRTVPDLAQFVASADPIKLLFATDPAELDGVVSALSDDFGDTVSVLRSHEYFGEVTALGVHKGSAIMHLARHLGVAREDVVAIGDEENDLPMIRWAGLGLAMTNAPQSVREGADAVVPSIQEDGVAVAIETYLLNGRVR